MEYATRDLYFLYIYTRGFGGRVLSSDANASVNADPRAMKTSVNVT